MHTNACKNEDKLVARGNSELVCHRQNVRYLQQFIHTPTHQYANSHRHHYK